MKKYKLSSNQDPQMIIEVSNYAKSAGKFVLVAMQGNSQVLDLLHGLPQEIYLQPKEMRYFKYFHFSSSDFIVKISREIGYLDIHLLVCKSHHDSSIESF